MSDAIIISSLSSLLISSIYSQNKTTVICLDDMTEKPYLDITIQMIKDFGGNIRNKNYKNLEISNKKSYKGKNSTIEGDFSSAAFYFLIAAICKSKITVKGLIKNTKHSEKIKSIGKWFAKNSPLKNGSSKGHTQAPIPPPKTAKRKANLLLKISL